MVILQGLTNISVLLVYLGLAGVLGRLLGRGVNSRLYLFLSLIFGVTLFLPSSIWLPWGGSARFAVWALAMGLVVLFAAQPESLPKWLWSHRFGLVYFGGMMLLTVIWALFTQQTMQWVGLGLSALLTGLLIIMRTLTDYRVPRNNHPNQDGVG
jgi:hypothetical protein